MANFRFKVGEAVIQPSSAVRNLGFYIERYMTAVKHMFIIICTRIDLFSYVFLGFLSKLHDQQCWICECVNKYIHFVRLMAPTFK